MKTFQRQAKEKKFIASCENQFKGINFVSGIDQQQSQCHARKCSQMSHRRRLKVQRAQRSEARKEHGAQGNAPACRSWLSSHSLLFLESSFSLRYVNFNVPFYDLRGNLKMSVFHLLPTPPSPRFNLTYSLSISTLFLATNYVEYCFVFNPVNHGSSCLAIVSKCDITWLKKLFRQVLMIDDRNSVTVRRTNVNNRFSESLPDYEDVKVSCNRLVKAQYYFLFRLF